jgi:DNA-binding response OmpR family regulator
MKVIRECTLPTGGKLKDLWQKEKILSRNVCLTEIEHRLLHYLMDRPNQTVSKTELLRAVWQYEWLGCTRVVEVYVHRLRKKIEDTPEKPQYLITRRGVGYEFITDSLELLT